MNSRGRADRGTRYASRRDDVNWSAVWETRRKANSWKTLFSYGEAWAKQARLRHGVGYQHKILFWWLLFTMVTAAVGLATTAFWR